MNIDELYLSYGFEIKEEGDSVKSYLYKKGRYFGVDIVRFNDSSNSIQKVEKLQKEYAEFGYAVNVKILILEKEIEAELFKSFFTYEATIARLKRKYKEFEQKQSKSLLGNKYVYIDTPFELRGNSSLVVSDKLIGAVKSIIDRDGAHLIIIEAAAGYGKTCAAYELLNTIVNDSSKLKTPLFTELSKNRAAKIFRYILLDEIDVEYPTLNSDLVLTEVKSGRIPLIIDGFDELLDKVNVSNIEVSDDFEEIETMLDTIGNLLENGTKVILTTRKTAIFNGLEFERWTNKWDNRFHISRFTIMEPRIKDWIGEDRFKIVKDNNVPIQYLANPVLLSYLRNSNKEDFDNLIDHPETLVENYFNKLLERERERQNLILTVEKQYEIFKNVAKMLLSFDIKVESKDFFKEIIKDQNFKLLEYTRTLYSGPNKPTVDNLVDNLATHALLDRKGRDENQIGFVNDFILGILVGDIICESSVEKIETEYSYYMLDMACTAYRVQSTRNKNVLWNKVNDVSHKLQPISIFNYDISLKGVLVRNYTDLTIQDYNFFNIDFVGFRIDTTLFIKCYFKNCSFDITIFSGTTFLDCTFHSCSTNNNALLDSSKEISIIKCVLKECQILQNYDYPIFCSEQLFNDFEIKVLHQIWNISGTKTHHMLKLFKAFPKTEHKLLAKSLNDLTTREFIQINGSYINYNINKLHIIKTELGI